MFWYPWTIICHELFLSHTSKMYHTYGLFLRTINFDDDYPRHIHTQLSDVVQVICSEQSKLIIVYYTKIQLLTIQLNFIVLEKQHLHFFFILTECAYYRAFSDNTILETFMILLVVLLNIKLTAYCLLCVCCHQKQQFSQKYFCYLYQKKYG